MTLVLNQRCLPVASLPQVARSGFAPDCFEFMRLVSRYCSSVKRPGGGAFRNASRPGHLTVLQTALLPIQFPGIKADEGNRTLIAGLARQRSALELHPHK